MIYDEMGKGSVKILTPILDEEVKYMTDDYETTIDCELGEVYEVGCDRDCSVISDSLRVYLNGGAVRLRERERLV